MTMTHITCCTTDTATTGIYTLSLHDALPSSCTLRCPPALARAVHRVEAQDRRGRAGGGRPLCGGRAGGGSAAVRGRRRSEEHTSELQSRLHLVCRLLLEKKNKTMEKGGERHR